MARARDDMRSIARIGAHATAALFAVVLLAGAAPAAAADARDALIDEVIELSGLGEQFEQIPLHIQAGIEQRPEQGDRQFAQRLGHILIGGFSAPRMRAAAAESLRRDYDETKFRAWIDMLQTPLVRRMAEMERQGTTAQAQEELKAYAPTLAAQAPDPQRLELLRRLADATGSAEIIVTTQLGIAEALMRSSMAALPENQRPGEAQFQGLLAKMYEQARAAAHSFLLLQYHYIYRSATDDELRDYVGLYESPVGRWSTLVLMRAVKAALAGALHEVNRRLAKEFSAATG